MMWIWLLVPLMYLTLVLLIRAEERSPRDLQQIKILKPLCTLLVILICALSLTRPAGSYDELYTFLILAGLVLSLVGDVLLIPQDNPKAFLGGLVAFLSAHVMYIIAFIYLQFGVIDAVNVPAEIVTAILLVIVGALIYRYLSPGLGEMRIPVIAYVVIISLMVDRAVAISIVHPGPAVQPVLIVAGASLFYISDAILAANKFRMGGQMPHYRMWNLSTYYSGQLLIALSASFFL
jgi:uncharacterized membrane protein YhhN